MEAPDSVPGTPADGSVPKTAFDQVQPGTAADQAANVPPHATTAGDRILANMSRSPVETPADAGPRATDPVRATHSIDIGDPMDRLEIEMQMARVKEATGLAVSATQKSSQGVDTLLKSQ